MLVEKFTNINDYKIRYLEGKKQGSSLILIHGLGASADRWYPVTEYLEGKYHLVIPDLIGFGYSDKPAVNYTIDFFVQFLHDFIESINVKQFDIIGSSLGGQIVAEYSVTHRNKIRKMILVSPSGINPRLTPTMKEYALAMLTPNKERVENVFQMMNGSNKPVDPMIIDEFIVRMQEPNSKMVVTSILLGLRNSDFIKVLPKVNCSSLVVWGDKDSVNPPRYAKIFVSSIKNCDFVLMKGCGHTPFVDEPQKFSKIIQDFLEK